MRSSLEHENEYSESFPLTQPVQYQQHESDDAESFPFTQPAQYQQHETDDSESIPLTQPPQYQQHETNDPESFPLTQPAQYQQTQCQNESQSPTVPGHRLARFWGRTAVLVLVPLSIAVYYLWIYIYCLRNTNPVKYASFDQSWIFYSWFVVGVFGLDISRHGLLGAEAAMLQTSFWQARSTMTILAHSDNTWSGLGGWLGFLFRLRPRKHPVTGRLWLLLSLLSIFAVVAFPLSGLTMEIVQGYVPSSSPAMVIGHTWHDFDSRQVMQTVLRGTDAWRNGLPTAMPGIGLVYTPPYLHRADFSSLDSTPNALPMDGVVPEVFLPGQANNPVSGKSWGLRMGYNCSIVQSASEFTILNKKSSYSFRVQNSSIYVFNSSDIGEVSNLWAYAEMGMSSHKDAGYDGSESTFAGTNGKMQPDILEYALWQVRTQGSYPQTDGNLTFNASVEPSIVDMGHPFTQGDDGKWQTNLTFFKLRDEWGMTPRPGQYELMGYANISQIAPILSLAAPTGVRCLRISELGTAELDVKHTTFASFQRSSPSPWTNLEYEARTPRFGGTVTSILMGRYFELFSSVNAPPAVAFSNSQSYTNFVQSQTLLKSIMRAHTVDALQLMYDGMTSMDRAYLDTNLKSTKTGKILQPGTVSAIGPAVLFVLWGFGSAYLGLRHGIRRRWSGTLDGWCLFRFGADLADDIRNEPEFSSTKPFHKCEKLAKLPGLVGDARIKSNPGHISLVEKGNVADTTKLYT